MSDQRHPFPPIDPTRNQILLIVGRKGTGKSAFARELLRNWPNVDKLVIDPTGDADPGADLGTVTVSTVPMALPARGAGGRPVVMRYLANPASSTYADDLDRAVGLALFPKGRRVVLWVDEAGEVFPAGRLGPHARTLLQQSRHWHASALLCTPRPINIDPLCLSQADRLVMYDLPHPRDRERVAGAIGVEPRRLAEILNETRARGEHWFTMYVAHTHSLYRCPPLRLSGASTSTADR